LVICEELAGHGCCKSLRALLQGRAVDGRGAIRGDD
jgi:hypothetical protein